MSGISEARTENRPDTATSAGTHSDLSDTAKATGLSQQSPPGSPAPAGYVSGIILRRPGDPLYGTLTLTRCYATKLVMTDYYGRDISEKGKQAICAHLDAIAQLLSTESGTMSSEIPLCARECPEGPLGQERRERITGDVKQSQQRLLWEDSGE